MDATLPSNEVYEEFLALFARQQDRLFAYIYTLLPHRADAEDVFQRCSLILWRKFAEYDREKDFLSWACGVAFYEVKNFLRSAERERLQFSPELMEQLAVARTEQMARSGDRLSALRECVDQLKAADRDLVAAFYGTSEQLSAFAAASGLALQTAYNRLSRIRQMLMKCVDRRLAAEGAVS